MATININGELRLDETAGNQDSDTLLADLPTDFSTRLFTDLGLNSSLAASVGVGESPDDFIALSDVTGATEISFSLTDGTDSGLETLDGEAIYLYADTTDPNIVYGIDTADGTGDVIFALYLDPAEDGLTAKVWSVLIEPLSHGDDTDPDDAEMLQGLSISAESEAIFNFDEVASGNFYYVMLGSPTQAILISSSDPNNLTTNTSQGGVGESATIGAGSQMTGDGEALVITFVSGADADYLNKPSNAKKKWGDESDIADALPAGSDTLEGSGGSIIVSQGQGGESSSLVLSAFLTDLETGSSGGASDYSDGLGDDSIVTISSVIVETDGGGSATPSASDNGDGTWTVTGLEAGDVVRYTTSADHNRIVIAHDDSDPESDAPFDIGGVSLAQSTSNTLGLNTVFFDDDGPTAAISQTGMVTHDETSGVDAGTDDQANASLPAAFAGLAGTLIGWAESDGAVVNDTGTVYGTDGAWRHGVLA